MLDPQDAAGGGDVTGCLDCPIGAVCNGSSLVPALAGSTWVRVGDALRIASCPAGNIVVRSVPGHCIVTGPKAQVWARPGPGVGRRACPVQSRKRSTGSLSPS